MLITEVGIRRIVSFCPYSSRFNETVPPQRQPRQKTLKKLTVRVVIAGSFLHTIKSFVSLWQDGFGRRHDVPVTGHDAVCVVRCGGFSGPNWTAPCLKSRIHRSCLLINFCRVNAVPSPPRGRRWPIGRMSGLSGSVLDQSTKPECPNDFKHEWRGLSVAELAKSSGFPGKSTEVCATSATNFP